MTAPSAATRSMPAPSITAITRSVSGKVEKGPSWATSARETRQPQLGPGREPVPPTLAISLVTQPPFFLGVAWVSDVRMRRVEEPGTISVSPFLSSTFYLADAASYLPASLAAQ